MGYWIAVKVSTLTFLMRIEQLENVERIPLENHFILSIYKNSQCLLNVVTLSIFYMSLITNKIIIIITINKIVLMAIDNNTF